MHEPALKPGQVTRSHFVRVIWVRPGLKFIQIWPGLDHVKHEIKEYMIWRCNNVSVCCSLATPTFVIVLWWLLVHKSHTPVLYVYVCAKSNHSQARIEPRPLIDGCCMPQKCYPCSMPASHGIAAVQSTCIRPLHHSNLMYLQYANSTISNARLHFSYPGLLSGSAVVTQFQHCYELTIYLISALSLEWTSTSGIYLRDFLEP